MKAFIALILFTSFFPFLAQSHPDLLIEQMEENEKIAEQSKYEIDPNTGQVKYEIKPNFIKGSPVHEKMTMISISTSNIHGRNFDLTYDLPYLKGIFWNDDPEQMLCPWCDYTHIKKWGPKWAAKFLEARSEATRKNNPVIFSNGDNLLSRSHFGDLQFIHAMAYKDNIPAKETLRKILIWAEFTYRVGTGEISGSTKIKDVQIHGFPELFSNDNDIYNNDIATFFHDRRVKRVAIGSLLHLIQDSYSLSHVDRKVLDNEKGRFCRTTVIRFHTYSGQDTEKHTNEDKWPSNLEESINDMVCDPISAGAKILEYYAKNDFSGEEWIKVKNFLVEHVFKLENPEELSGPGERFRP
ncbi:MAG: hypothetical protein MRK00_07480 [Nitrosomonas sp.]|nr:hypothetical protein [Nitrosomonas sp.]